MVFEKICPRCNKAFLTRWHFQRYCGSKRGKTGCSWEVQREQLKKAVKKWGKAHEAYFKERRAKLSKEQKERYLETARRYYHNHQEKENNLNRERKNKIKLELTKLLGSRCSICGYDKCIAALDFHHIDPADKEHKEDWKYKGFAEKVLSGKIRLLCANCHREIHHLSSGGGAVKPEFQDGVGMQSREDWIRSQCSGTILDIGSANGWVFKGSGLNVTCLDINEYAPGEFPQVAGNAHALPFKDKSFDCCVLAEILEHVHNPILVLKEAIRVARRKVVFTVPDEHHWSEDHKPLWTIEQQMSSTHLTTEQLYRAGNPTCIKVNDPRQGFHNRWYTKEILKSHLDFFGLPYQIQTIAYDGWSWFCGTILKENGSGV